MTAFSFTITHSDPITRARVGIIQSPHGCVQTPILAPVGTQATVKALTPEQIEAAGAQMILANTYHLYLRPGAQRIADAGGIHRFMACDLPIMTDSGGFQVFSLGSSIRDGVGKIANIFPDEDRQPNDPPPRHNSGALVRVDDHEVRFRSHLDGSLHSFTPERSMQIQSLIGADFVLTFDECTSPLDAYEYTSQALERTHRWAHQSLAAYEKYSSPQRQALFGIVQGGAYRDLREKSAALLGGMPCFGYSIGGSLGRSKSDMHRVLDWSVPLLPSGAPRHMLGIGEVDDIFACVERGIDIFDCVIPTRWARTGAAMVSPAMLPAAANATRPKYRLHLRNAPYATDDGPIDPHCGCYTCRKFTRAYLHHLYRTGELLVYTLVSMHNIYFLTDLMRRIRASIADGSYPQFKRDFFRQRSV